MSVRRAAGVSRKVPRRAVLALVLASTLGGSARAADPGGAPDSASVGKGEWDVTDPGVPRQTMSFGATEGTWISVDVSPDGKRLVFDLLGDLYLLPVDGGEATPLSTGIPWEIQPRFSPDGSRVLFTSDRGGGDNLWIVSVDGKDRKQLTTEDYRLFNNGVWHPSGDWVVAKKHFTSTRSMGAGEMWMVHVPEGGSGVQLTERKNDQMDAGEPCFGPRGRFLYWSEDMSSGNSFQYNKNPLRTIYVIRRLDLETGEIRDLIDVAGGAVRPQVSPDGTTIAFVRRVGVKSALSLFDLETGAIRRVWDGLDEDQQETWSLFGVHPGFAWMPDGKSIVISAKGKLWRVDVRSGEPENIPFHVNVELSVADPLRFAPEVGRSKFSVKVIRWPRVAGDGSVVFQALGTLWKRGAGGGGPRALFPAASAFRFAPNLSPDGDRLVYVTWSDVTGGTVRTCSVEGKGERTVMARPGHYAWASFSPDAQRIVVQRGAGDRYRGHLWDEDPGIWIVDADGKGDPRFVMRGGSRPRFNRDGTRLFVQLQEDDRTVLASVNLLGSERRDHVSSERAFDIVLSPDERWVAFEEQWQTYVAPLPLHAGAVEVAPTMKSLPVKRLSSTSGTYLSWSPDSRTVNWSLGPTLYSADVESLYVDGGEQRAEGGGERALGAEADSASAGGKVSRDRRGVPARETPLGWEHPADVPDTDLWITGATILPMDDLSRIEDGVVHVVGNRIVAVGPRAALAPPEGARTVDATGKTLLPGYVDVHAHTGSSNHGVIAQQNWAFLANLAFGVTTTHDPSNNTQMILAQSELRKAGRLLGPRVFSTGTILYGAEGDFKTVIDSYDDALDAVGRQKAWGAFSVKSYNQPRRDQRQMVIRAGRELEMMVVPEGGSTLQSNLNHLVDGHTTLEHALPVAPLYDPALRLLSRFGSGYTPTLVVGYGGLWGENYWYQHSDVWRHERLLRFVPDWQVEPRARRRSMAPEEDYHHFALARTAAEVVRRGGNVEVGAHGQMQGLGTHWELWMLEQGGLTPHEALRCATWMGARCLGLDGSLGAIREGLLADLILVEGDPAEDVRRSEFVSHVMINGRLYDARTLEQLAPDRRPLPEGPPKQAGSGGRNVMCLCQER